MVNEKPCLTCTRVKDPADCEIKNCKAWRDWWIEKWEEMRSVVKMDGDKDSGLLFVDMEEIIDATD